MKHLNCSGQGRQPPFSLLGRQNWLLKLMRQYVLSGFWPQWKKVQQRKEQKIWIIGVEGKPNGKHTCMCFCPESLPSRRPSWGFSGSYRAKWELAPEIISFFFLSKFMVLTMGGSRCQSWSTILPVQSTISFVRFRSLNWRLAGL